MRGRNKPWAKDFIAAHENLIYNKYKHYDFLTLEVGIGKGDFILQNAKYNDHVHHIGVELNTSIYAMAMKKLVNENITNVSLLNVGAKDLLEYINSESIDIIYLNFSDPWPQNGYRKRRLVHPFHLEIFEKLLKNHGKLIFKTDNEALFNMAVKNFNERNYQVDYLSYDYQTIDGDFVSEYEAKFRALGQKIYRIAVTVNKENLHLWVEANK